VGVWEDFKGFVIKGNLITVATAFVVALAVTALITAIVNDLILPVVAAAFNVSFADLWKVEIDSTGSFISFGALFGALINFLILLTVIFFIFVYPYNKAKERWEKKEESTTRRCPMCYSEISQAATRCAFCTSTVVPTGPPPS
jgi:large conductance mechanosensitive channel